jgi:outer membrane protein OmpA-like peptidoglycan-associated protein
MGGARIRHDLSAPGQVCDTGLREYPAEMLSGRRKVSRLNGKEIHMKNTTRPGASVTATALLASAMFTSAMFSPAMASAGEPERPAPEGKKPSKEESIGMLGGATLGAAVGGPPGAFVGLVLGAWLGDRMDTQKSDLVAANRQLAQTQGSVVKLGQTLVEADRSIAQLTGELKLTRERLAIAQAGLPSLPPEMQESLRGEVLFRTNESVLRDDTGRHLARLAGVLAATPGAMVQLDAHADARGSDDYNFELSQRRAEAVRDVLVAGGLSADRITIASHGEKAAVSPQGDVDGYALERRVVITIGTADVAVAHVGEALPLQ